MQNTTKELAFLLWGVFAQRQITERILFFYIMNKGNVFQSVFLYKKHQIQPDLFEEDIYSLGSL